MWKYTEKHSNGEVINFLNEKKLKPENVQIVIRIHIPTSSSTIYEIYYYEEA